MDTHLHLEILPQPDDTTCGPTCLDAVYRYYRDKMPLAQVISEVRTLAGVSATYRYRCRRENAETNEPDDIRGEPVGHFVVLCGYDTSRRSVLVADPLPGNPNSDQPTCEASVDRVTGALLLGIVTCDANLLIVEPKAAHPNREPPCPPSWSSTVPNTGR